MATTAQTTGSNGTAAAATAGGGSSPAADAQGAVLDTPGTEWPEAVEYGATLLGARLYRRRNSPAGVETFGQLGAVYVMRNDPDVAMLLKLGPYARPQVG